jgi:hypothetical protein
MVERVLVRYHLTSGFGETGLEGVYMAGNKRPIYREKALQRYAGGWEKSILPRIVAPSVFTFLWVMLALLFTATLFSWLGEFPTYATGAGLVLAQSKSNDEAQAVVFLPANASAAVRVGSPVLVQIGSTGPHLTTTIASVGQNVMSPSDIRQRYALTGTLAGTVTQPSHVLMVNLGPTFSETQYAGSLIQAQVQVGMQRVLSLLPGLNQSIGG